MDGLKVSVAALAMAGLGVCANAAFGQAVTVQELPPETFKHMSAGDLAALTDKPGPGSHTAIVTYQGDFFVEFVTRSDIGNVADMHTHWTDHIQIVSGEGTLTYGGTIVDPKEREPGDVHGGTIAGGTTVAVHVGDYVQIPPGMPHLMAAAPGTKMSYVRFKGRQ